MDGEGLLDASLFAGDAVVAGGGSEDEAADAGESGGEPVPIGWQGGWDELTGSDKDAAKGGFPGCFFHEVRFVG